MKFGSGQRSSSKVDIGGNDLINGPLGQMMAFQMLGQKAQAGQQSASQPAPAGMVTESYNSPFGVRSENPAVRAQENIIKSQATAQASPPSIPVKATNALGIESIIPVGSVAKGGEGAVNEESRNMTQYGQLADRAIAEMKNAVASYKNVLAERKASGADPYSTMTSLSQDYLSGHPWQRKMAGNLIPTSQIPGYQTSKDAFGGAMAAMFVQGQRNPQYAQKLGSELTPSLTSTGPEEDTNLIRQSILTPIATQWALGRGLIKATDLVKVSDWSQLQPIVALAQKNGWNPNSPEVQSMVNDVLKTPPSNPNHSDKKFAGFDYSPKIKQYLEDAIAKYPDKKAQLLQEYKNQTGEEYNG